MNRGAASMSRGRTASTQYRNDLTSKKTVLNGPVQIGGSVITDVKQVITIEDILTNSPNPLTASAIKNALDTALDLLPELINNDGVLPEEATETENPFATTAVLVYEGLVESITNATATNFTQIDNSLAILAAQVVQLTTGLGTKPNVGHGHEMSEIVGLVQALDNIKVPPFAMADVTGLTDALSALNPAILANYSAIRTKANINHTHVIADVTGLQEALDNKDSGTTYSPTILLDSAFISSGVVLADVPQTQAMFNNVIRLALPDKADRVDIDALTASTTAADATIISVTDGLTTAVQLVVDGLSAVSLRVSDTEALDISGIEANASEISTVKGLVVTLTADVNAKQLLTNKAITDGFEDTLDVVGTLLSTVESETDAKILIVSDKADVNKGLVETAQAAADACALIGHTHTYDEVRDPVDNSVTLTATLNSLVALLAVKAGINHGHVISDVAGLQDELNKRALTNHVQVIGSITGLGTQLSVFSNDILTLQQATHSPTNLLDSAFVDSGVVLADVPQTQAMFNNLIRLAMPDKADRSVVDALSETVSNIIDNDTVYDDTAIVARVATLEGSTAISLLNTRIVALESAEDSDTVYDDTQLATRITTLENASDSDTVYDDTQLVARVVVLESVVDSDTVYDDTQLATRVSALEAEVDSDTVYDDAAIVARVVILEDSTAAATNFVHISLLATRIVRLESAEDSDTVYDDTQLSTRITTLENASDSDTVYDDTQLVARVAALEGATDSDTVYDDAQLVARVSALEAEVDSDTVYDDTQLLARLTTLEDATDSDTVYNDTALTERVTTLETTIGDLEAISYDDAAITARVVTLEGASASAPQFVHLTVLANRIVALESAEDSDTVYDDSQLSSRIATLENTTDSDTVYNDTQIVARVSALEGDVSGISTNANGISGNSTAIGILTNALADNSNAINAVELTTSQTASELTSYKNVTTSLLNTSQLRLTAIENTTYDETTNINPYIKRDGPVPFNSVTGLADTVATILNDIHDIQNETYHVSTNPNPYLRRNSTIDISSINNLSTTLSSFTSALIEFASRLDTAGIP